MISTDLCQKGFDVPGITVLPNNTLASQEPLNASFFVYRLVFSISCLARVLANLI